MSTLLKLLHGSGTLGAWVAGTDRFKHAPHIVPLRDFQKLVCLGAFARNKYLAGSDVVGLDASSSGDKDISPWFPWEVDNSNTQLSGFTDAHGASLIVQMRYYVRVSNAAITVTPKVVYGTSYATLTTVATISGQAACSATASDYSGTNQIQTVLITLPTGLKWFKPRVTIGGTPAAGYLAYVRVVADLYVGGI